jgi:hypothetical protein
VVSRLHLAGVVALAPAPGGVWYLRAGSYGGRIGRSTLTSSLPESAVGPAPVALAETTDALFVLEGQPAQSGRQPRTNVIERLDPVTLRVEASSPVTGLGTDIGVAAGRAWVVTSDGVLHLYRLPDLKRAGDVALGGGGDARIAIGEGAVWVLDADVSQVATTLVLHRVDPDHPATFTTARLSGTTVFALSAGPAGTWVGTGSASGGLGAAYRLSAAGFGPPVSIPTPNAFAGGAASVWWASADGHVGSLGDTGEAPYEDLTVGTGATDIAISEGLIWVAADDLVAVRPT